MPQIDFPRILKRVTETLNANVAGTYSATIPPRNKTRNADAIKDACYEAGLKVLQTIGSYPNEFRAALVTVSPITHGAMLPEHLGKPAFVEIQAYSGAQWREAKQRQYLKIESYRQTVEGTDNNFYDRIAHNAKGSSLGGYYDVWDNKFYFTGFAARIGLAQASRDDVYKLVNSVGVSKIPDFFENTIYKLGLANSMKVGENGATMQIASAYAAQAENDLQEFKAGRRNFSEASVPEPTSERHE